MGVVIVVVTVLSMTFNVKLNLLCFSYLCDDDDQMKNGDFRSCYKMILLCLLLLILES